MRWECIKQSWALARKSFPNTKRLFVDLPDKYKNSGSCNILDLEEPAKPLGTLSYKTVIENNKPKISFQIEKSEVKVATQKTNVRMVVTSQKKELQKKMSITASDVMCQYQSPSELAEKVAYLIVGHEDGIKLAGKESISDDEVYNWISTMGFPDEIMGDVEDKLVEMGVKVAKKKKSKFENYEKVRVVDPGIMQYQEGARVIRRKRDKDNNYWYFVIVDGSETPVWLNEKQLDKNTVGAINPITGTDCQKLVENSNPLLDNLNVPLPKNGN